MTSFLSLLACGGKSEEDNKPKSATPENVVKLTDAQYKNAGVEVGSISQKPISSLLKLNGKIDVPPQNMVSISVPMGGFLKSTDLLEGMPVSKGQVLGVMEDEQYIRLQQDYLTAKADLGYTEAEFNRQKQLNQSKAASDKVFQQARASYQKQQVMLSSLEQKLRLIGINPAKVSVGNISRSINIHSPISGFVSAVNVNIGKFVNPTDVLFELVNPADIHLALTVFEKDLTKLAVGQKLFAYTNTNPEKKYPCKIILISKSLSDDRATQVHCHFERYDKTLIPGTYMNAEVEISGNEVSALPDDAVVRFENKQYVFLAKGKGQFQMQEIKTGNAENGFTEIIDAEKLTNQTLVTKGAYNILMALKNTSDE